MALMNLLVDIIVLLLIASISAVVDGQMDGCGSDLSTFLPSPFNSTGLSCRPIWKNFILRHSQDKDNIMSIVLSSVYTSGWVGMGFSGDGMMVGSSAMVGWIGRDGRAHIKQYYLRGQSSSDIIVNEGQLLTTSVEPAVVIYGINLYMAFQLKFSAPLTQQKILLAFATATPTNYHLTVHDDKISISFDFSGESVSVSGTESVSSYPYKLKRNHGVLNIFGWGFLLPIGAITPRYFKRWDPSWYYLHVAIQLSGFMFGLAGVVAGISLYAKLNSNVSAHRGLGIFVLVLSILQIIAFFARPDKDSKIRKYWNWYHHWAGRLAVFLASVNIVFGIQVGGGGLSWNIVYGINLSLILVAITILEIMLWTRWPKHSVSSPAF